MLTVKVQMSPECWDDAKQEFVSPDERVLRLEHSLISVSKWESKWCKSFFSNREKTPEETLHYIECMCLDDDVDPEVYSHLSDSNIKVIFEYVNAPMTATHFAEEKSKRPSKDVITSELIYYWMTALNVPFECQTWHLNRLLTLIHVCNVKNQPDKKMSKREIMSRNSALNAARRKQYNTRG